MLADARRLGAPVPERQAIIGVDDSEPSRYLDPALSSAGSTSRRKPVPSSET
ncbi:hypothetical protein [Kribbella sp. NPDC051137]|uniref:hypothetical protein n=1 Tax=Kribbella sp. NPDC051137 TaxID=3155045 RepID=UPI003431A675